MFFLLFNGNDIKPVTTLHNTSTHSFIESLDALMSYVLKTNAYFNRYLNCHLKVHLQNPSLHSKDWKSAYRSVKSTWANNKGLNGPWARDILVLHHNRAQGSVIKHTEVSSGKFTTTLFADTWKNKERKNTNSLTQNSCCSLSHLLLAALSQ